LHDDAVESIVIVVIVPAIVAVFVVVVSIIPIGADATTTVIACDVVTRTGLQSTTSPMTQRWRQLAVQCVRCCRLFGSTSHINAATMSMTATRLSQMHPGHVLKWGQLMAVPPTQFNALVVPCWQIFCCITTRLRPGCRLIVVQPKSRGRSLSRAQLPFDCCVSDGEDKDPNQAAPDWPWPLGCTSLLPLLLQPMPQQLSLLLPKICSRCADFLPRPPQQQSDAAAAVDAGAAAAAATADAAAAVAAPLQVLSATTCQMLALALIRKSLPPLPRLLLLLHHATQQKTATWCQGCRCCSTIDIAATATAKSLLAAQGFAMFCSKTATLKTLLILSVG
jgi:hypothetical protein